jgi:hypothetical protein
MLRAAMPTPVSVSASLPARDYIRGETVVYGKIESAGGVRPTVRLRVSDRQVLRAHVTQAQCEDLAKKLYRQTALRGDATWDPIDGSVVYFRTEEIIPYEPTPILEAFAALRKVVGDAYDHIEDVDAYAESVRKGDAP